MLWKVLFPELPESSPEVKLWTAVMIKAVQAALGGNVSEAVEARNFFFGGGESRWMFNWICQTIDLDPDHVRDVMALLIERRREGGPRSYQQASSWLYDQAGAGGAGGVG